MKVFISWSGRHERRFALFLREWLAPRLRARRELRRSLEPDEQE